ncbi:MAG: isoprenylcysteine carboxylmethyltransferase family protein [Desulfobacteraceae bacterium]|jgi:protein-S-isoprenylcysteine O-methyltransferase Ste14
MTTIKSIIFIIVLPGAVMVYAPYYLLSLNIELFFPDINVFRFIGLIPISIGAAIILWCLWDFIYSGKGTPAPIDPPKNLVVKGLYRLTRNPMYVGVLFVLFGEILLFESTVLIIYSFFVWILFNSFVVFYEEPTLKDKFGHSYEQYIDLVPRWLPDINLLIETLKSKTDKII